MSEAAAPSGASDSKAAAAAPAAAPAATATPASGTKAWDGRALRSRCECHNCIAGLTTELHADASHDQSLHQTFTLATAPPEPTTATAATASASAASSAPSSVEVTIRGGTTKCARVAVQYFASAECCGAGSGGGGERRSWRSQRVVEVGAGTGLVSICLARLGARVIATDQEPVMDTLRANIRWNTNPITTSALAPHALLKTAVLQWGDDASHKELEQAMLDANFDVPPTAEANVKPAPVPAPTTSGSVSSTSASSVSNLSTTSGASSEAKTSAAAAAPRVPHVDVVVGSDLIYAKEGIPPLVATYERFLLPASNSQQQQQQQQQQPGVGYLVSIFRFEWEREFFARMSKHFVQTCVLQVGDIRIDRFDVRTGTSSAAAAATTLTLPPAAGSPTPAPAAADS
jgi:predicted nicotinamide N-methyase